MKNVSFIIPGYKIVAQPSIRLLYQGMQHFHYNKKCSYFCTFQARKKTFLFFKLSCNQNTLRDEFVSLVCVIDNNIFTHTMKTKSHQNVYSLLLGMSYMLASFQPGIMY